MKSKNSAIQIIADPNKWSFEPAKVYDPKKLCCDSKILMVKYGNEDGNAVFCYIRDSILRALRLGDMRWLPASTETGFVIVDKVTKLQTPSVLVNSRTRVF